MENASKALLIAGAVLICILLIGIGVAIYNASKAPSEHAKVTSEAMGDESRRGAIEIDLNLKFAMGKRYTSVELTEMKTAWNGSHEANEQLTYSETLDSNATTTYKVKSYIVGSEGVIVIIERVSEQYFYFQPVASDTHRID